MDKKYKIETFRYNITKINKDENDGSTKIYYEKNDGGEYIKTTDSDFMPNKDYYEFDGGKDIIAISVPESNQNSSIKKIVDLKIQAEPYTKFIINNNDTPIIIGETGIFEWHALDNEGYINSIKLFEPPNKITDNINNMKITYGYYE